MGWKRKISSCLDGFAAAVEAHDCGYDVRLARRWKRRRFANQNLEHNASGKNSCSERKCKKTPKRIWETKYINVDSDDDGEVYVDNDYKKYLDILSAVLVGDSHFSNLRSAHNGDPGSGKAVENMSADDDALNNDVFDDSNVNYETIQEGNNIETGGRVPVDDDYKKYLDTLSKALVGDNNFSNRRYVGSGNSGGDTMVEDVSANDDAGNNNDNFVYGSPNVNSVNGFAENGNSDEELVENGFLNNDNNNNAFSDVGPQFKNIPESRKIKINDGKQNADYMEYVDGNTLGQSGDIDVYNDQNVYNVAVKINAVNQAMENGTCGNWLEEEVATTVDGGSFQTQSANNDAGHNDNLDNNDPDYKFFLENLREDGTSYVLEVPLHDGIALVVKYELDDRCRVENHKTMRSSRQAADMTKHGCKSKVECDLLDESYKIFMNSLKIERGRAVFVPENGAAVVYDDEEESSSDSDVIIMDTEPFVDGTCTPFVPSKTYDVLSDDEDDKGIKGSSRNDGWFRQKVIEILKKPYDPKEYEKLSQDAHHRKPVKIEKENRSGRIRQYTTHIHGKSYLDIHTDLAREIDSAGCNQPKKLNLLRGFFFWLENVVHDGSFKPWEDPLCLQVLPHEDCI